MPRLARSLNASNLERAEAWRAAGGQRPSNGSMVWTGKPFDRQGQEARWQGDTSISDTFD